MLPFTKLTQEGTNRKVNGQVLEKVDQFKYLRSAQITDDISKCSKDKIGTGKLTLDKVGHVLEKQGHQFGYTE